MTADKSLRGCANSKNAILKALKHHSQNFTVPHMSWHLSLFGWSLSNSALKYKGKACKGVHEQMQLKT